MLHFLLFVLLLWSPVSAIASESGGNSGMDRIELAASEITKAELLLFWDEKDLYVQSATRNIKPISQVADNMSVVTAKEIEEMGVHTVAEVLERVPGVYVDFLTNVFGSPAFIFIQGSENRHVLVLLDGVPWNFLSGGNAETNNIPLTIIKRIEVIKGPASSVWGSSLGGVVNIITKDTGEDIRPSGSLSASYGEKQTQDYNAEISGKVGTVGYYLYAGHQESSGLRQNRAFDGDRFYSKLLIPLSKDVKLGFTYGYSETFNDNGDLGLPAYDLSIKGGVGNRSLLATASLDAAIAQGILLNLSLYTVTHKPEQTNNLFFISSGEFLTSRIFASSEKTTGLSGRVAWSGGAHTVVLGTDISRGEVDENDVIDGAIFESHPAIDKWAVYANDTIVISNLTLTPGIRYDHNSISGSFTSPSLGITYKFGKNTIARASVSRGFTLPPLAWTSGRGLRFEGNPDLKPEEVWSYQAGIESGVTDYLWFKASVFYHDMKNSLAQVYPPYPENSYFVNNGNIGRQGVEIEAETAPFKNISAKAGFAYAKNDAREKLNWGVNYAYIIGVKYDDRKSFMAQLSGRYVWWDNPGDLNSAYNTFIWDLNLIKKIYSSDKTRADIFLTAHNIFNGAYYFQALYPNPHRWIEAGLRFKF